ncbi:hypothetical protein BDB00DRAFT_168455 [Zychaea mexicana]|uniref:uncharacterized protein n=1 Tax=Zychaea mexicana TaxID=64656 RepID=UPI0022FF2CB2|nr:uncharacterized protein BDB00DRAFT_168455 [Zychaea mexicana]KAI9482562.1 hypothetical protein BDB00DRAFT_168455 [Zychaea mexicana]
MLINSTVEFLTDWSEDKPVVSCCKPGCCYTTQPLITMLQRIATPSYIYLLLVVALLLVLRVQSTARHILM